MNTRKLVSRNLDKIVRVLGVNFTNPFESLTSWIARWSPETKGFGSTSGKMGPELEVAREFRKRAPIPVHIRGGAAHPETASSLLQVPRFPDAGRRFVLL